MSNSMAASSLRSLSDFLSRYYGKKVIILLDEYDRPMQEAYVNGYVSADRSGTERRERMCEAVEKYAKDYAKEYVEKYAEQKAEIVRLNSLLESIKNLMDSMKWSAEQAMSAMKVSEADKALLLKEL